MPQTPKFLTPSVIHLMTRIEIEEDRETLEQLFLELNLLLNGEERQAQPIKKLPLSIGFNKRQRENTSK